MRVKYSLIFLTASLIFLIGCTQDVFLFSSVQDLFRPSPPKVKTIAVHADLQLPMKLNQRNQHAFQEDQLITLFTPQTSSLAEINTSAFTPRDLDSKVNYLFSYPADEQVNPYGFAENETIDYPDSIYRKRFRLITSEIPLVYNHQVKNFIDVYAARQHDLTQRMLGKKQLYYPYIEQVLTEKQLPDELKHLVMVESALQTEAYSSMAAVGLWQIRSATGRSLGLEINSVIDERLDPYAATDAAINYLNRLYEVYGDWLLAIAAYNCGPGNLNKAIVRSGGSRNFWRVNRYLPRETRSYVPAFMALAYLNYFQAEHNLQPEYPQLSFRAVDTVRLYQEVPLQDVAVATAVTMDELRFLNPALIKEKIPFRKEGFRLVLPINKVAQFEQQRDYLLNAPNFVAEVEHAAQISRKRRPIVPDSPDLTKLIYQVRRGNTLISIARRYGCSVKDIQDWNGKSDHIVRVGEELNLYIPRSKSAQ
jgi:membrane-bound lytic murein transglycosylase D